MKGNASIKTKASINSTGPNGSKASKTSTSSKIMNKVTGALGGGKKPQSAAYSPSSTFQSQATQSRPGLQGSWSAQKPLVVSRPASPMQQRPGETKREYQKRLKAMARAAQPPMYGPNDHGAWGSRADEEDPNNMPPSD